MQPYHSIRYSLPEATFATIELESRFMPCISSIMMSVAKLTAGCSRLRLLNRPKQPTHSLIRRRSKSSAAAEEGKTIPSPNSISCLPLWQQIGPLSKSFSAFGRAQRKRPYVTQLVSSLVIYLCGDLSAQRLGGDDYDPWRTCRNMVVGGICSVPSYKWYELPRVSACRRKLIDNQVQLPGAIFQLLI